MVGNEEKNSYKKPGLANGLVKNTVLSTIEYLANITDLDLSNGKITSFNDELELPPNTAHLKLSNNKLTEVPPSVLKLDNLKTLDLSFNLIVFFDDSPCFCHTIEQLNLSNNKLEGPPLWIWAEKPKNLACLNLSNNRNICQSFTNGYFEELLQYKTLVNEIDIHNCKLDKHLKLLATFNQATVINVGCEDFSFFEVNNLDHVPCAGLEECLEVETLNLSNTHLYHINSNIDIYKHLKELNLAQNNINSLPNEFCNLENLQSCKLSFNKLLYLPDDINKLTKLVRLYLDNNELCMLPETLQKVSSLKTLDLYNNNLWEAIDRIDHLEEIDLSQNYFEEPNDEDYLLKKGKLRVNCLDREDARKIEEVREESVYSKDTSDDEELFALVHNQPANVNVETQAPPSTRSSSPEDWDSDDYWIPQYYKAVTPPRSPWLYFVKKKMEEGNFCPMDAHPVSIAEKVKYEKMCNPPVVHESDGQYDDYSDDDS